MNKVPTRKTLTVHTESDRDNLIKRIHEEKVDKEYWKKAFTDMIDFNNTRINNRTLQAIRHDLSIVRPLRTLSPWDMFGWSMVGRMLVRDEYVNYLVYRIEKGLYEFSNKGETYIVEYYPIFQSHKPQTIYIKQLKYVFRPLRNIRK